MAQRVRRSDPDMERFMNGTRQMRGQQWPDNGGTGKRLRLRSAEGGSKGEFSITNNCTKENEIQSQGIFSKIIPPDRIFSPMIDQCDHPRPRNPEICLSPLDLDTANVRYFNINTTPSPNYSITLCCDASLSGIIYGASCCPNTWGFLLSVNTIVMPGIHLAHMF